MLMINNDLFGLGMDATITATNIINNTDVSFQSILGTTLNSLGLVNSENELATASYLNTEDENSPSVSIFSPYNFTQLGINNDQVGELGANSNSADIKSNTVVGEKLSTIQNIISPNSGTNGISNVIGLGVNIEVPQEAILNNIGEAKQGSPIIENANSVINPELTNITTGNKSTGLGSDILIPQKSQVTLAEPQLVHLTSRTPQQELSQLASKVTGQAGQATLTEPQLVHLASGTPQQDLNQLAAKVTGQAIEIPITEQANAIKANISTVSNALQSNPETASNTGIGSNIEQATPVIKQEGIIEKNTGISKTPEIRDITSNLNLNLNIENKQYQQTSGDKLAITGDANTFNKGKSTKIQEASIIESSISTTINKSSNTEKSNIIVDKNIRFISDQKLTVNNFDQQKNEVAKTTVKKAIEFDTKQINSQINNASANITNPNSSNSSYDSQSTTSSEVSASNLIVQKQGNNQQSGQNNLHDGQNSTSTNPTINNENNNSDKNVELISNNVFDKYIGKASNANTAKTRTFSRISLDKFPEITANISRTLLPSGAENVKMALSPEGLGTVFVNFEVLNGALKLSIKSDNDETLKKLEQQIGVLKESISRQGLKLENIELSKENTGDALGNKNEGHSSDNTKESRSDKNDILKSYNHSDVGVEFDKETMNEKKMRYDSNAIIEKYI
ncbi:MAG: hypothetical protein B7C24_16775 [Bacteroidetes bacterium 4572_77]|nr:MAG: hypothetical protein B7C24_16775 [Bacteroidetes bacterium 4572_77]